MTDHFVPQSPGDARKGALDTGGGLHTEVYGTRPWGGPSHPLHIDPTQLTPDQIPVDRVYSAGGWGAADPADATHDSIANHVAIVRPEDIFVAPDTPLNLDAALSPDLSALTNPTKKLGG